MRRSTFYYLHLSNLYPKNLVEFVLISTLLTACQPTKDTASTDAASTPDNKIPIIVAQTPASIPPAIVGLKKTDFPVYLDGVPSLLHPIIPSVPLDKKSANFAKSQNLSDISYFQQTSPYSFQSSVYNLVFEDIKTGTTHHLFPQDNFVIKSVFYPFVDLNNAIRSTNPTNNSTKTNSILATQISNDKIPPNKFITKSNKLMLGHFIYQVKEKADDDDSKTNIDDQLSLYMSDDKGEEVIKLHPNEQYVKDTKWLPELQRFYFITQADTNGDKIIDENDKYFNYVIDFNAISPEIKPYEFNSPTP